MPYMFWQEQPKIAFAIMYNQCMLHVQLARMCKAKKYLAQAIQHGHRRAFPCLNPHYIVTLPVAAVAPECTQFVTTSPDRAMYVTDTLLLAARDLLQPYQLSHVPTVCSTEHRCILIEQLLSMNAFEFVFSRTHPFIDYIHWP